MKKRLIVGGVIGFILLILTVLNELSRIDDTVKNENIKTAVITQSATQSATQTTTKVRTTSKKVANKPANSGKYKITHYGPDCKGCSGITASGFNAKKSIYYRDKEYGNVRIVATNKSLKLYSIIKIHNYKMGGDIIAIVLDRGVGSGVIDLLVNSEKEASKLGIQKNVAIEVLRKGK